MLSLSQTISVFNIVIFGLAALSRLYDDEPEKMVAGLAGIFVNVVLLCGVKVRQHLACHLLQNKTGQGMLARVVKKIEFFEDRSFDPEIV